MRHIFKKGAILLVGATMLSSAKAVDLNGLLGSVQGDTEKLMKAYTEPAFNAMAAGLNTSWNHSASRPTLFSANFKIVPTFVQTSSADKIYDVSKLGLENLTLVSGQPNNAPTIIGDATAPTVKNEQTGSSFQLPSGTSLSKLGGVFVPVAQLSIGTGAYLKYTEFSLRFVPQTNVGGFQLSQFGLAVKHDIMQWIPGVNKLSLLFNWAVAAGYNSMNFGYSDFTGTYSGSKIDTKLSAFHIETIVSKKILFVTPSLALGYGRSNYNLSFTGVGAPSLSFDGAKNNLYATLGLQVNILFVGRLYAGYSFGTAYNSYSAGLGIGIDL